MSDMRSVRFKFNSSYIDKPRCSVRGCDDFARVGYTRRIDGLDVAAYACNIHSGDVGMMLGDVAGAIDDVAMSPRMVNILADRSDALLATHSEES